MRLIFDCEANGLLDDVTVVHCISAKDIDTKRTWQFRPHQMFDATVLLSQATELLGQNLIGYDLPMLEKVLKWKPKPQQTVIDTLIFSRLAFSDLERDDWKSYKCGLLTAKALVGSHSLEAWGIRLDKLKGDYGKKQDAWDNFSEEMLEYNMLDVEVNECLFEFLMEQKVPQEALDMELRFAFITEAMSRRGISFNREAAVKLCGELRELQQTVESELQRVFVGKTETLATPAYYQLVLPDGKIEERPSKGECNELRKSLKLKPAQVKIEAGPLKTRHTPFNPNSRDQVREVLYTNFGWLSSELTDGGQKLLKGGGYTHDQLAVEYGKLSEETLTTFDNPLSKTFLTYLMQEKLLSQIEGGQSSWLKNYNEKTGRIHHRNITIGCATHRNAHSGPNLGQVPAVMKNKSGVLYGVEGKYGWESRSLFHAAEGYKQVGVDLSGIESRMLAHFLSQYDDGAYIDQVLSGDIHQLNADSIKRIGGYEVLRNDTKTPFYAYMYGAGDTKLGTEIVSVCAEAESEYNRHRLRLLGQTIKVKIDGKRQDVDGSDYPAECSRIAYATIGRKVRESFEVGITGLSDLLDAIKEAAKRGYLTPLDKRRIPVRSEHAALNTLLQGSAAIVMKRWTILAWERVAFKRLDAHLLAVVHDEHQAEVVPKHVEEYCDISINAIRRAGEHYKLKIPLAGEAKIGNNWAECH